MKAVVATTGAFCMKSRRISFSENHVFLLFGPKRLENYPFELPFCESGIEFDEESEKHGPGGQKRTKSVRFGSVRFGSVRFGSIPIIRKMHQVFLTKKGPMRSSLIYGNIQEASTL